MSERDRAASPLGVRAEGADVVGTGSGHFHPSHYELTREWWIQQAEIEHDRAERATQELAAHRSVGAWGRECALVSLRMLKRAGKLKATTDDERKVIEWAEQDPWLHQPGANRRLGSPFAEEYSATAESAAQAVLFGREAA